MSWNRIVAVLSVLRFRPRVNLQLATCLDIGMGSLVLVKL